MTNFVNDNSTDDPWGIWYKVACSKLQPGAVVSALHKNNVQIVWLKETIRLVLDALLPLEPVQAIAGESDLSLVGSAFLESEVPGSFSDLQGVSYSTVLQDKASELVPFIHAEVRGVLIGLKASKEPGPGIILVKMLREAWGVLSGEFNNLFNDCPAAGNFPACWKAVEVCSILKTPGADTREKSSYRPISLLPVMGKWLEGLMVKHLQAVLEANGWLDSRQFGFIIGCGIEDALFRVFA